MNSLKKIIVTLGIGLMPIIPLGVAFGAEANRQFSQATFEAADQNQDKLIDETEFISDVVTGFVALDTDKDRQIHKDELAPHNPEVFSESDVNADGYLSLQEVIDSKLNDFNKVDANEDGVLSLDEVMRHDASQ